MIVWKILMSRNRLLIKEISLPSNEDFRGCASNIQDSEGSDGKI